VIVNELRVVGEIEIPNVEVDDEFTLEVRLRVFSIERDQVDVSDASGPATLPGSLRLEAVAIKPADWPTPAEVDPAQTSIPEAIPPDYWETAE
jgi:hypothetical protein